MNTPQRTFFVLVMVVLCVSGGLLGAFPKAQTKADIRISAGGTGIVPPKQSHATLYDQTDSPSGNGAPDQNFEATYDTYDCEAADDFEIPAGVGWDINQINTVGTSPSGSSASSTVNVWIYPDDAGMPGPTAVFSRMSITPVESGGSFQIPLSPVCHLEAGRYWLAIQVNQDYDPSGQHFWSNRSTQTLNESVWRNPPGGFGTPCTAWGRQRACGVGGGTSPDFLFAILGDVTNPIPTVDAWGAGVLVVLLVGLGYWMAIRRT